MKKLTLFAVTLIIMLLAACSSAGASDLGGTSWQLTEINGGPPAADATLEFNADATEISGNTGCNDFSGQYSPEATSPFAEIAATERACEEPEGVMAQEETLLEGLRNGGAPRLDGDTMIITSSQGRIGTVTLTFEQQ